MLDAGEQGVAPGGVADGLDQAGAGVVLHQPHQAAHGGTGHQAVGVEHDHEVVLVAVGGAELADIAGLAPGILLAAAIADRRQAGPAPSRQTWMPAKFALLGRGDLRVAGVAEDEEVEVAPVAAGAGERPGHHPDRREDRGRILGMDRHHGRGAAAAARLRGDRGGLPLHPRHHPRSEAGGDRTVEVGPGDVGLPGHREAEQGEHRGLQRPVRHAGAGEGRRRQGEGRRHGRQEQGQAPAAQAGSLLLHLLLRLLPLARSAPAAAGTASCDEGARDMGGA